MRLAIYWGSALLVLVATVVILRVIVRRGYARKGHLTPFSSASQWLLCMIWAAFSSVYLPGDWPALHVGPVVQAFGWVCVALGAVTLILAIAWLGLQHTNGLAADVLVQAGPYGLSRNPQLVGFGLGLIGFAVLWASFHMLVSVALFVVLAHVMVLTEEEHLCRVHGEHYKRYIGRVPRYVGLPARREV
jgi:protein-S-isoprenylcysteine O-methyltransferase Ste14